MQTETAAPSFVARFPHVPPLVLEVAAILEAAGLALEGGGLHLLWDHRIIQAAAMLEVEVHAAAWWDDPLPAEEIAGRIQAAFVALVPTTPTLLVTPLIGHGKPFLQIWRAVPAQEKRHAA